MASFSQLPSGLWRAQVSRLKVRMSKSFGTKEDAELWVTNVEAQILGSKEGAAITLTKRELFDLYARSKERARSHGIDYQLTREQVEYMFLSTNGRCAVTWIMFNRFRPMNSTKRPWYPSLDRIDSSKPIRSKTAVLCASRSILQWVSGENGCCYQWQKRLILVSPLSQTARKLPHIPSAELSIRLIDNLLGSGAGRKSRQNPDR
jgi:hypothetical protein